MIHETKIPKLSHMHKQMGMIWYLKFSASCIFLIAFLIYNESSSLVVLAASSNDTDFHALLDFKAKITKDPFGVLDSWNDSIDFCQWNGVTCGVRHKRVTMLELNTLSLTGSISPSIGNLTFLRILRLKDNFFSHEIPPEIGRLRRLEQILLRNNSIGGKIPTNFTRCSNLKFINFNFNKLEGEIPTGFGDLSKLVYVAIENNYLTGTIPNSVGNLSYLSTFSLLGNHLVGNIPDTFGQLKNLTFLSLSVNNLSGTIHPSVFNLSSVEVFDIGSNYLEGELPSDLGFSLSSIQYFSVGKNNLTGNIPASLSNASNLMELGMSINKFTGKVPSLDNLPGLGWLLLGENYLGNNKGDDLSFLNSVINVSTGLELLEIDDNNFGGVLPSMVSNFSVNLTRFHISSNNIWGRIPIGIGNLVNLESFDVSSNQLSGRIPHVLGNLQNLKSLGFSMNKFFGDLPSSLGNLTELIELDVSGNNLGGSIPSNIGSCKNLLTLDLSRNNFSHSIPKEVVSLSSLSIVLDLSQNKLTGALPNEVGNLKSLGRFDVSGNKLSGEIPSTLGSCTTLEALNMSSNNFQGSIPSSFKSLKAIQVLDLSLNNLSGEIPEFLSSFVLLAHLNLSYNNFEGLVPTKGVFGYTNDTSIQGNNRTCGGIPAFHLPSCVSSASKKSRLTPTSKLVISITSSLLAVTFVLFALLYLWFRQKKRKQPVSNFSQKQLLELSYQTLYNATDGFSSANLIGAGSFGSVFKGILVNGRTSIAVKVFNLIRPGAIKSFLAECEALRNIKHRNLVKVLTVCSGIDYHGNDFKALVYELMINGSLEDWLHPPEILKEGDKAPRMLSILQRFNIAIDIANALDYLHHQCETPIVHCDLKPSNILLDEEMTGHVGDFGLAKIFLASRSNDAITQSSSVGIRGTTGYAPPEYGMGNKVSTNGDVYSYGILLLETFTGKRPTDDRFTEGLSLHHYVKAALPEQVVEILDPNLVSESTRNTDEKKTRDCFISMLHIGVACSAESPEERMSISEVIAQLISIRNKLQKSNNMH